MSEVVGKKKKIIMIQRTELIEQVGNLIEIEMNYLLKKREIVLVKNPDRTSQQYFFFKNSKLKKLTENVLLEILEEFKQNFSSYGLECVLDYYCIYFGIAHLSTSRLESTLNNLKTRKL